MKYMLILFLLMSHTYAKKNKKKKSSKKTKITKSTPKEPSNWKHKRIIGTEIRQFGDDAKDNTQDQNIALTGTNISRYEKNYLSVLADLHVKYDPTDNNRNLINIRNLFVAKEFGGSRRNSAPDVEEDDADLLNDDLDMAFIEEGAEDKDKEKDTDKNELPESTKKDVQILFGFQIHNWTSMQKFSPADSVNSHIFDGVWENPAKKGEFTVSLQKRFDNARLTGYIFPRIERPFIPKKHSQTSFGYNLEDPIWMKRNNNVSDDDYSMQASIRFEHFLESFEYSLHYLRHINTEVSLVEYNADTDHYTQYFFETTEIGLTTKIKSKSVIYNLEAALLTYPDYDEITTIHGDRKPKNHGVVALGLRSNPTDKRKFNWSMEFQTIVGLDEDQKAEQYLYQADLFFGMDYNFRDKARTQFSTGLIVDVERESEQIFEMSFKRDFNKKIQYDLSLRATNAPVKEDIPLNNELFHNTNYMLVNINYQL